ncbi:MAG: hypothetical protein CM15mP46_3900 [Alphaproteobacteria bacterium]|nr:MAG: hypothetical protein CM15mP46_3900 [Alphaproteobacteria bacterium]
MIGKNPICEDSTALGRWKNLLAVQSGKAKLVLSPSAQCGLIGINWQNRSGKGVWAIWFHHTIITQYPSVSPRGDTRIGRGFKTRCQYQPPQKANENFCYEGFLIPSSIKHIMDPRKLKNFPETPGPGAPEHRGFRKHHASSPKSSMVAR